MGGWISWKGVLEMLWLKVEAVVDWRVKQKGVGLGCGRGGEDMG